MYAQLINQNFFLPKNFGIKLLPNDPKYKAWSFGIKIVNLNKFFF